MRVLSQVEPKMCTGVTESVVTYRGVDRVGVFLRVVSEVWCQQYLTIKKVNKKHSDVYLRRTLTLTTHSKRSLKKRLITYKKNRESSSSYRHNIWTKTLFKLLV